MIRLPLISLFFFLGCISIGAFAFPSESLEEYPVSDIPGDLQKNVNAVVRHEQMHFQVLSPGKGRLEIKSAITILNEKGDEWATISVYFDDNLIKAKIVTGELFDANGTRLRKLKRSEIKDVSYQSEGTFHQDMRLLTASMKSDKYPYTVYFQYVQEFDGLFYYPSWTPQKGENISVQLSELLIETPPDLPFRYKNKNLEITPIAATSGDPHKYFWKIQDLKAIVHEPFAPPLAAILPEVEFAPTEFEIEGYRGNMEDWKGFGAFYYELNKNRDVLPDEAKTKIVGLTANATSDREKIDRLYRYMQANTRYVGIQLGIGGWQTFDAAYVYENGYGDCKALSNYMKSMLKEVNIEAFPVLIYRGEISPEVDPSFPFQQFNHVILCAPLPGDTVWLECTNSYSPPGYLDQSISGRTGVLITPEGGFLVKTPSRPSHENTQIRKVQVTLNNAGDAEASAIIQYKGHQQDLPEVITGALSERQKEKWLRSQIKVPDYDLISYQFIMDSIRTEPICYVQYELTLRHCGKVSGSRQFLTLNQFEQLPEIPPPLKNRTQPIIIPYARLTVDSIYYSLPQKYVLENIPNYSIEEVTSFGKYKARVEYNPEKSKLLYIRELWLEEKKLPVDQYNDVRDFFIKASKSDRIQVVLSDRS